MRPQFIMDGATRTDICQGALGESVSLSGRGLYLKQPDFTTTLTSCSFTRPVNNSLSNRFHFHYHSQGGVEKFLKAVLLFSSRLHLRA